MELRTSMELEEPLADAAAAYQRQKEADVAQYGEVAEVFYEFDADRSGFLDETEVVAYLGSLGLELTNEQHRKALDEMEMDGTRDGLVSLDEFVHWWQSDTATKKEGELAHVLVSPRANPNSRAGAVGMWADYRHLGACVGAGGGAGGGAQALRARQDGGEAGRRPRRPPRPPERRRRRQRRRQIRGGEPLEEGGAADADAAAGGGRVRGQDEPAAERLGLAGLGLPRLARVAMRIPHPGLGPGGEAREKVNPGKKTFPGEKLPRTPCQRPRKRPRNGRVTVTARGRRRTARWCCRRRWCSASSRSTPPPPSKSTRPASSTPSPASTGCR